MTSLTDHASAEETGMHAKKDLLSTSSRSSLGRALPSPSLPFQMPPSTLRLIMRGKKSRDDLADTLICTESLSCEFVTLSLSVCVCAAAGAAVVVDVGITLKASTEPFTHLTRACTPTSVETEGGRSIAEMKGRRSSNGGASLQKRLDGSVSSKDDRDHRGARPFAPQGRSGGTSSRSWSRKRKATRPSVSAEGRMAQPIKHIVPLDLSFGNFEFQEMKSLGKRGGGVRELSSLLRQARRKAATHVDMLHTRQGAEMRSEDLLSAAIQRSAGMKVKDDPHRIAKALAKRRSKKRQSAKRWAKRIQHLEDSVENAVKDRSIQKHTMKARKQAKVRAQEKKREGTGGSKPRRREQRSRRASAGRIGARG
ncbi:hypothetical protein, conserved [Leishmania tarentolae]|uniref:Ribosomal RNA-processing protein 14/surfeit locus protein 6 C-terminal domain-containing protein n=1 Tax=Leishmania tarentolae TaxID=5689 RepID=A0A640KMQ5_LEITA|nr:hypothetical protein, conserved [Leishmania tarentolae]